VGLKPSTQAKQLERVRSFFGFCVDRGWIEKNPTSEIKPPKELVIAVKPFTPDELEKILWAVPLFPIKGIYGEKTARASRRSSWCSGGRGSVSGTSSN
jgi:site-specific recombinase XerD